MKASKGVGVRGALLFALLCGCGGGEDAQTDAGETPPAVPAFAGPAFTADRTEHDFGLIWDTAPVTTTFPFRNTGSQPLRISRTTAGCGCTTPVADRTLLQPGETGTITVTFDPAGRARTQDKKVTIFSNAINTPEQVLMIRSVVRPFVEVNPKFVQLGEMVRGIPFSSDFTFESSDPDFRITRMVGSGKHGQYIRGEELPVVGGQPRRVRIHVSPDAPWGAFHSQLEVTGEGAMPDGTTITHTFKIYANGQTYGAIRADDFIFRIGTVSPGAGYNRSIELRRPDGLPFSVLNSVVLQPSINGINIAVVPLEGTPGPAYDVIVSGTVPANAAGPFNAEAMIQTDIPGEEILRLRIAGLANRR